MRGVGAITFPGVLVWVLVATTGCDLGSTPREWRITIVPGSSRSADTTGLADAVHRALLDRRAVLNRVAADLDLGFRVSAIEPEGGGTFRVELAGSRVDSTDVDLLLGRRVEAVLLADRTADGIAALDSTVAAFVASRDQLGLGLRPLGGAGPTRVGLWPGQVSAADSLLEALDRQGRLPRGVRATWYVPSSPAEPVALYWAGTDPIFDGPGIDSLLFQTRDGRCRLHLSLDQEAGVRLRRATHLLQGETNVGLAIDGDLVVPPLQVLVPLGRDVTVETTDCRRAAGVITAVWGEDLPAALSRTGDQVAPSTRPSG